jgi:hypothetical protein
MSFRAAPARFSSGRITVVPVYADAAANIELPLSFQVNGPYNAGGSSQIEVMLERVTFNMILKGAKLLIKGAGSSGTTEVDVQKSEDSGATWTSVFSTKPSVSASAGSYAVSSNAVISGGTMSISNGTLLRLNITGVQSGSPDGFILQLLYGV